VLDVAAGLGFVQRPEVIGRDDALAELLHRRRAHQRAQFGLPHQEALQQRAVAVLEVRQHAQFLDGTRVEVLRLVDHQQRPLALLEDGQQEGSIEAMRLALSSCGTRMPKALATERSRSSASSWVLTICAATIVFGSTCSS